MSREAWGDPPDRQEPPQLCPVCGGEWHAEGCELGEEVSRRMKAEDDVARLRAALDGLLRIHTEPAGFSGKYGKDLDKAIAAQQAKIDARVAAAKAAIGVDDEH